MTSYRSTLFEARAWRALAWIGVGAQIAGLLAVFMLQRHLGAAVLVAFLAFSLGFLMLRDRIPSLFDFFIAFGATANALGWTFNLFERFVWYDEFIHFYTGFAGIAAIGFLVVSAVADRASKGQRRIGMLGLAICPALGLLLGIGWELIEMTFLDLTWTDTLADIALDTGGAILASFFVAGATIRRSQPASRKE